MRGFNRTTELELQANEKGALGLTLLKESLSRRKSRNLVEEFVIEDLDLEPSARLDLRLDFHPDVQKIERNGKELPWRPDVKLQARKMPKYGGELLAEYFVEVKTGEYAEYRNHQREVMQGLAQEGINTLTIFITLDGMPEEYGMRIRKMGLYDDN